ncbi:MULTISPECIES: hypothetical protein [unclassified Photobacterium]|uniref:hypothetical protein n=1 Tax=unclassified Photobacterium TaxID=2628852 RepID=UPI000D170234|nr:MULTISPECIES: hypothetical protein [unclassified Photobacterium]PSV37873.1 hypothetical protein C9J44_05765 [Photobacterium sp. GB-27]PSV53339.1 hypothetical protein C9J45_07655 [Photobacterium sp. GB-1]PSW72970.1 hypothetical protein C9J41_13925 [Photobacterium sp. GB-50]
MSIDSTGPITTHIKYQDMDNEQLYHFAASNFKDGTPKLALLEIERRRRIEDKEHNKKMLKLTIIGTVFASLIGAAAGLSGNFFINQSELTKAKYELEQKNKMIKLLESKSSTL